MSIDLRNFFRVTNKQEEIKKAISKEDLKDLKLAKNILENPSLTMKIANYIGKPIELGIEKINSSILNKATQKALTKSLDVAIFSLNKKDKSTVSNTKHKVYTTVSGGVGGFFGLASLVVELPISTTIMLRSIADIAEGQGHNLNDMEIRLACLEVFSLGSSKTTSDDGDESAYFTSRGALALEMKLAVDAVSNMSNQSIQNALAQGQLPVLVKLINSIASKFGVTVSEKLVAQSIPIVGAVGGASLNLMFINHFQNMAEGHFIVKRLENTYGKDEVFKAYNSLSIEK
jgi:hypothetical protein